MYEYDVKQYTEERTYDISLSIFNDLGSQYDMDFVGDFKFSILAGGDKTDIYCELVRYAELKHKHHPDWCWNKVGIGYSLLERQLYKAMEDMALSMFEKEVEQRKEEY